MTPNAVSNNGADQRLQQLVIEIRNLASRARTERLHPIRVQSAIACGKALSESKALVERGRWNRWLQDQCGVNRMTANRYIRLASRTEKLTRYMTLREAYIASGVIGPNPAGEAAPVTSGEVK